MCSIAGRGKRAFRSTRHPQGRLSRATHPLAGRGASPPVCLCATLEWPQKWNPVHDSGLHLSPNQLNQRPIPLQQMHILL